MSAARTALTVMLAMTLWAAVLPQAPARPAGVETLMAFESGGPHAVFLLDAFNAGDTVSNWVSVGNAMNTLCGRGVSVVARPCGHRRPQIVDGLFM